MADLYHKGKGIPERLRGSPLLTRQKSAPRLIGGVVPGIYLQEI